MKQALTKLVGSEMSQPAIVETEAQIGRTVLVDATATTRAVAARMCPMFYKLLRVHPQLAIRHPALPKILRILRESRSRFDGELLKRISARLVQPESKPHLSEDELLEMYEKLHVRAGDACKDYCGDARKRAIREAFPELGTLEDSLTTTGVETSK